MDAIREVYGDIDSSSDTDSGHSVKSAFSWTSVTSKNTRRSACNVRQEEVWNLSYYGVQVQAYYRKVRKMLEVFLSSPGFPTFSLKFEEPLPTRTFLLLPGGSFLLAFSRSHEVCVWSLSRTHTNGEDVEINSICDLMDALKTLDDSEYCQNLIGIGRSRRSTFRDRVFSIEVTSAKLTETEEAIILTSVFKNGFL